MSFLLDVLLMVILIAVVVLYAKRTIFGALSGLIAVMVAATAAVFLTNLAAVPVSDYVVAPMTERAAANELADMFSAPHLTSGRATVSPLPLGELVEREPDAYRQMLAAYSVSPDTVRTAYAKTPTPETVLNAITAARTEAVSQTLTFLVLTLLFLLLLRLIANRIEQNFPPPPRYFGAKRLVPGLLGAGAGLILLWVITAVLCRVVPTVQGQLLFLSEDTLQKTDWLRLLWYTNPFLLVL